MSDSFFRQFNSASATWPVNMLRDDTAEVFGRFRHFFTRFGDGTLIRGGDLMVRHLIHELVEFDNVRQSAALRVPAHLHHFFQMDLVLAGRMELRTRDGRMNVHAGFATLIPPLETHGFVIENPLHYVTFKFRLHPHYGARIGRTIRVFAFGSALAKVARFTQQWSESDDPLNVQCAVSVATLCLVHAMRALKPSPQQEEKLATYPSLEMWTVINDVMTRPDYDWTVRAMAERCGLSLGHFGKTFARWHGLSPRRFLLESRILAAADQLYAGEIKSVARGAGYANVHSFSRAFKRATGLTPGTYVKRKRPL